jgi:uncharacterized protein (TIGR02246 family)
VSKDLVDKDKEKKLHTEMRRVKPSEEAIAAALEAAQRLAAEADAEQAATDAVEDLTDTAGLCDVCGYRNRGGNKFCGMCGVVLPDAEPDSRADNPAPAVFGQSHAPHSAGLASPSRAFSPPFPPAALTEPSGHRPVTTETHHYHHHYHYFQGGGYEAASGHAAIDPLREEKMRPTGALRGDMSRAEAAVRRLTQEWVLACNTKHLDDLLDLYVTDSLVLRSNYPPVRGAAAVREFFFGALDAGLGEVEIEPLRVEVIGDLAYEAGRCKALVPGAAGKRREERGKYLWVCARQSNGEWKLAADCWSSDLALTSMESDVPASTGVKTREPRKTS